MLSNKLGTDQTNNMFYLLLMSYITELPEDLKRIAKGIKEEDIIWSNANDDYAKNINNVRKKALLVSFVEADSALRSMERDFATPFYGKAQLMKQLINVAADAERDKKEMFINALADRCYTLAYKIFMYGFRQRPERPHDRYYKNLLETLINIQKGIRLRTATCQRNNIYNTIGYGDFGRALWLITCQYNGNQEEMKQDPLYIFLSQVVFELEIFDWYHNQKYTLHFLLI